MAETNADPEHHAGATPPDALPTGLDRWMIALCGTIGTWSYSFVWNSVGVALPQMKGSFAATNDQITWVMISFVVGSAMMTACTGWASATLGRKNVFLLSIVGFTVSLFGCGVSSTLEGQVFWRFLQGLTGAPLLALGQVICVNAFPPERYTQATSIWALGFVTGNLLAPVISGALIDLYGWPWIFYINVPIGVFVFLLAWHFVPHTPKRPQSLDWIGFLTLVLGVAILQLALARGERLDWFDSTEIWIETVLAVVLLYMFVAHTLTHSAPFVDRRLFGDRNFMLGQIFIFMVGAVIYLPLLLLPLMLQQVAGYPAMETGQLLFTRGIGSIIGLLAMSQLRDRIDPRKVIFFGILLTVVPAWHMSQWSIDIRPFDVAWTNVVQGIGTSCIWAPLNMLCLSKLDKKMQDQGFSLFYLNYDIGNAFGTSIIIGLHARQSQISHTYIAEGINSFNAQVRYSTLPNSWSVDTLEGVSTLTDEISRQAAMIAYNGSFLSISIAVALLIPFIIFFRYSRD